MGKCCTKTQAELATFKTNSAKEIETLKKERDNALAQLDASGRWNRFEQILVTGATIIIAFGLLNARDILNDQLKNPLLTNYIYLVVTAAIGLGTFKGYGSLRCKFVGNLMPEIDVEDSPSPGTKIILVPREFHPVPVQHAQAQIESSSLPAPTLPPPALPPPALSEARMENAAGNA